MVIGLHFSVRRTSCACRDRARQRDSREVTATAAALAKRLGKIGVIAGNCPGFIGNRMINVYGREAQFAGRRRCRRRRQSSALRFRHGHGTAGDVRPGGKCDARHRRDIRLVRNPVSFRSCALGRLGQKTGKGWSQYDENRKPSADPEVAALIESTAVQRASSVA
jgi:3-hydroxyacyl-CoA dehydrogenase